MSEQQEQTLTFFEKFSKEWQETARRTSPETFRLAHYRNSTVKLVAREKAIVRRFLDIGCGSGELCLDLAKLGIEVVGVDFSESMIALCNEGKKRIGVEKASFLHKSILDYQDEPESFDLISALGLIEYISITELRRLLELCQRWLKVSGSLVLGSRNRLFNLISYNFYTSMELEAGTVNDLVAEAVALATSQNQREAMQNLQRETTSLAQLEKHPCTGIEVETRNQYTPRQLVQLLHEHGLETEHIFGLHYHGMPPRFKNVAPNLHVHLATVMQEAAFHNLELIPFCSTIVLHARKASG